MEVGRQEGTQTCRLTGSLTLCCLALHYIAVCCIALHWAALHAVLCSGTIACAISLLPCGVSQICNKIQVIKLS